MNMTEASANPFRLDDETALITGGGSGIGLGIARCMVRVGGRVVLVGRREDRLVQACAELGAMSSYVVHDVTRVEAAGDLVAAAQKAAGTNLTILINNAGGGIKKPAVETTSEEFQALFTTHVLAAHALTRAVIPTMVTQGKGSILFMSSMTAFLGMPLVMAYAAAKSAYLGMVSTLSAELCGKGVRVNAIAPGWILTDITRKGLDNDPPRKARVLTRIQMGRLGETEDVGWAAVYLCSPVAQYITGVTLPVDGGALVGF